MGEWKLFVDDVEKDFNTDYGFKVKSFPGTGHSPVINRSTNYALQDGALFTGQKMGIRAFTLIGTFYGSATLAAFHDQRQALIKALSSRTVKINEKPATVKLKYTGGTADKEIDCIYEGGLELAEFTPYIENDVPVRFTAFDPQWNATSDTVDALDTEDTLTAGRLFGNVDRVWGEIGTNISSSVYALHYDITNDILYACGAFVVADSLTVNRIAAWDGTSWAALGTGLGANCRDVVTAPNGDVYAGGDFTTAGGSPANYIAKWDGSAWSALGTGLNAAVQGLHYDEVAGLLYVVGSFTTAGGASANRIATWDGSTWATLGTGFNNPAYAVNLSSAGDLYAGGDFNTAGGVTSTNIAKWDGSTWSAISTSFNGTVLSIEIDSNDNIYAGGLFSFYDYIAMYNGSSWATVGGGMDDWVRGVYIDSNDNVYVCGDFLSSDPKELGNLAKWDGSTWEGIGCDVGVQTNCIVGNNIDIYFGTDISATPEAYGATTISYAGTENAYPVFNITRTGGTAVSILSLVNTTTGATIIFDYSLIDGEVLTVDFRPGQRSASSSVYGEKWDAIADNSDIANFFIQPGNDTGATSNIIALSITETGSPTTDANLTYRTAYRSLD